MVTVFKDLHMPSAYNKTIMKIARNDDGMMVKNTKNQQEQCKRKLEEAKKQQNLEEIGEMIGKGDEDASKMIKTENMIAVFENLHISAMYNRTIVKIAKKDKKQEKINKMEQHKAKILEKVVRSPDEEPRRPLAALKRAHKILEEANKENKFFKIFMSKFEPKFFVSKFKPKNQQQGCHS